MTRTVARAIGVACVVIAAAPAAHAGGPCAGNPCVRSCPGSPASDPCTCYATFVDPAHGLCECLGVVGLTGPVCRAAAGPCDIAETCVSGSCPSNARKPAGTACGGPPVAGDCDAPNVCTGASAVCPDTVKPAGTECRAAVGDCDVAEMCDGAAKACPDDGYTTAGTTCRSVAGPCDVPELCPGDSPSCPADGFAPTTTLCRGTAGDCDASEFCTGDSPDCPADAFEGPDATCRTSTGPCDPAETCPGDGADCPADVVEPDGTACDDGDECTVDDQCVATVCAGDPRDPCGEPDAGSDGPDGGAPSAVDAGTAIGDDAGEGTDDGEGDGGCGCRAGGTSSGSGGLVVALIAALGLAPRRRWRAGHVR